MRVEGKVGSVTGAARGQGRSHALRLAEEGADIIGVDICQEVDTVPYEGSTLADLEETARLVEELDRRMVASKVDVTDLTGVWTCCREITPHLIERGSGVIVITSSVAGLRGFSALSHYSAAKHGVVGLMRSLAHELGPFLHGCRTLHDLPVDAMEPRDISNAVLFLCSDEARWITGVTLPIDADILA